MDFTQALTALKAGKLVTRHGWNGRNQHLRLQQPTPLSLMSLPYISITTERGMLCPWTASQTDLLAEDWALAVPREAAIEEHELTAA